MNSITQNLLLKLLKDSIKEGRLLTNYNDYGLSLEDVVRFTEGYESKLLLMNSSYEELQHVKKGLEMIGIDYTTRGNTLKCTKTVFDAMKYEFLVEMNDEEYDRLCEVCAK